MTPNDRFKRKAFNFYYFLSYFSGISWFVRLLYFYYYSTISFYVYVTQQNTKISNVLAQN